MLLPEGYELVAGTSKESIHLYYDITKVSILANIRSISLVLTIPLKTAHSYFTLFKLIALPTQIFLINLLDILWILNTLRYNTSGEATCFH